MGIDVLVLCTGNICRSPMAEALLRRELAERGVRATVHSAGLLTEDRPASEHSVSEMTDRGLDVAAHRSRLLTAELVSGADLVIGMERHHVREAAVLWPDAFPRTFTLKELARRATAAGPRDGRPLDEWLAHLAEGRNPHDLLGADAADDVADPIGRSRRQYARCAEEIETLTREVVDLLWPAAVPAATPGAVATERTT